MIARPDHLALTTADEDACVGFYVDLLGMGLECFGEGRKALRFGMQKINIHVNASGDAIIEGPVQRTGATGPIRSIHLRDPDLDLIEISQAVG